MKEVAQDLVAFAKEFPSRFFDVAIAEQHAANLQAGPPEGRKPVCTFFIRLFSKELLTKSFTTWPFRDLRFLFPLDRGGLVADGATHHGSF